MSKVLLVEDDKLLGKSIKMVLTSAGFTVVWCQNSDEAFVALAQESDGFKLIYLDIMLPGGVDGYEILRRIKLPDSMQRSVPVIMLSNLGQAGEIERAMETGASDYVVKANIDLVELVELTKKKIEGA